MTQTAPLTPDQIAALAAKLDSFREALSPPEQTLLDDIMRRAARAAAEEVAAATGAEAVPDAEAADVQGYFFAQLQEQRAAALNAQVVGQMQQIQARNADLVNLRNVMGTLQAYRYGGDASSIGKTGLPRIW